MAIRWVENRKTCLVVDRTMLDLVGTWGGEAAVGEWAAMLGVGEKY